MSDVTKARNNRGSEIFLDENHRRHNNLLMVIVTLCAIVLDCALYNKWVPFLVLLTARIVDG